MSLLLALLVTAATLPADTKDAAMTCASAIADSHADEPEWLMTSTAEISYFFIQAAAASGSKGLIDRTTGYSNQLDGYKVAASDVPSLVAQCDKRWPKARSTAPVELPKSGFDRDLMCLVMVGVMVGAAESDVESGGDPAELNRYKSISDAFAQRLSDAELAKHGITTEAQMTTEMERIFIASLQLGNPERIAIACSGALKSG